MQAVADGRLDLSSEFIEHMNCCVGCRACETACPSGVQYGKLIEAAREQIQLDAQQKPEPTIPEERNTVIANRLLRRFFFDVMLPSRLVTSLVFGGLKVYQRTGLQDLVRRTGMLDLANGLPTPFQGKLKLPEELMDNVSGDILPAPLPEITPAIGTRRYRVGFISGCIMDQVFRDINDASIRVLTANGCEVITPPQQGCCGALHIHAGESERGRALARHNIDVFEQYNCDAIIINSAGCGSTLKEYGYLLRNDPQYAERAEAFSKKVKDISEFLTEIDLNPEMQPLMATVTYHDACHLAHGQKIKRQPRQLLQSIPGLTLVDLKESDWCCGSAGIYNLTNQEMGQELLQRKMDNVAQTQAEIVATGNPGCIMQIAMGVRQRGLPMTVVHPVQLLDEAYRLAGVYAEVPALEEKETMSTKKRTALLLGAGLGVLAGILFLRRRKKNNKHK
jgi:glycolate oxidase iron-sulfur subunit